MRVTALSLVLILLAAGCAEQENPPAGMTATPAVSATEVPVEVPTTGPTTTPAPPPGPWRPPDDHRKARFLGFEAPKPPTWIEHPPIAVMGRIANWSVAGRNGSEAGLVTVHYFGEGEGGDAEANIARWQTQFRAEDDGTLQEPIIERIEVAGMPVTLVELAGDWMKTGTRWYTPDQVFIAAVVEAPIGNVFIRFTGETATVEANREAFVDMILGLEREAP